MNNLYIPSLYVIKYYYINSSAEAKCTPHYYLCNKQLVLDNVTTLPYYVIANNNRVAHSILLILRFGNTKKSVYKILIFEDLCCYNLSFGRNDLGYEWQSLYFNFVTEKKIITGKYIWPAVHLLTSLEPWNRNLKIKFMSRVFQVLCCLNGDNYRNVQTNNTINNYMITV